MFRSLVWIHYRSVVAKCHHQQTVVYGLMRNGFAYLLQCVEELLSTSPMTFPTALEIQQKAKWEPEPPF